MKISSQIDYLRKILNNLQLHWKSYWSVLLVKKQN